MANAVRWLPELAYLEPPIPEDSSECPIQAKFAEYLRNLCLSQQNAATHSPLFQIKIGFRYSSGVRNTNKGAENTYLKKIANQCHDLDESLRNEWTFESFADRLKQYNVLAIRALYDHRDRPIRLLHHMTPPIVNYIKKAYILVDKNKVKEIFQKGIPLNDEDGRGCKTALIMDAVEPEPVESYISRITRYRTQHDAVPVEDKPALDRYIKNTNIYDKSYAYAGQYFVNSNPEPTLYNSSEGTTKAVVTVNLEN